MLAKTGEAAGQAALSISKEDEYSMWWWIGAIVVWLISAA